MKTFSETELFINTSLIASMVSTDIDFNAMNLGNISIDNQAMMQNVKLLSINVRLLSINVKLLSINITKRNKKKTNKSLIFLIRSIEL